MSDKGTVLPNSAEPAFAVPISAHGYWTGLSKREYIATAALQGMLANTIVMTALAHPNSEMHGSMIEAGTLACVAADALLEALAK